MMPAVWLVAVLGAWTVPGITLSRWILPSAGPLERVLTALCLGISTVAPTVFFISIAAGVPVLPELIAMVSALWAFIGWALRRWWPRPDGAPLIERARSWRLLAAAVLVAGATSMLTSYYALHGDYVWWHCPHHASLYLMADGSGGGVRSWDPIRERYQTNLFAHPRDEGFGVGPVLTLQRPGAMAFLVQPFVWMSLGGLVGGMLVLDLLVFGFAALLAARTLRSTWAPLLVAAAFSSAARWLSVYQLNENMLGLAITLGMLHLLLRDGEDRGAVVTALAAGLLGGHMMGIRPLSLLMVPAFALVCASSGRRLAAAVAAGLVGTLPWLYVNLSALGSAFSHPALTHSKATQTLFAGTSFEWTFRFHPLNWPLNDTLVRGPDDPFPLVFRVPLELMQAFGAPLLAVALVGLFAWRRPRRVTVGLGLWLVTIPLFLMLIVQLGAQKLSYLLMALAPLPLLVGQGARALLDGGARLRVSAVAVAAGLAAFPLIVRDLSLPIDSREQHADYVSRDNRKVTLAANPRANRAYQVAERERLGRPSLLPAAPPAIDLTASSRALGARLFARSVPAQRRAAPEVPIREALVVWSELAESRPLAHRFVLETTERPRVYPLHPETLTGLAIGSGSGTIYTFRFAEPAPDTVTVGLLRPPTDLDNRMRLTIESGRGRHDQPRYAAFMVVDPPRDMPRTPALSIDGRSRRPYLVLDLRLSEEGNFQVSTQVVSNYPWRVVWRGGVKRVEAGRRVLLDDAGEWRPLCGLSGRRNVVERCDDQGCRQVVLDARGAIMAVRRSTSPILTVVARTMRPFRASEPCVRRLFARPSPPVASR